MVLAVTSGSRSDMAKPICVLATETPITSPNASALTSPGGTFSQLDGDTGADWLIWRSDNAPFTKTQGGHQLAMTVSSGSPTGSTTLNTISFDPADSTGNPASPTSDTRVLNAAVNDYIRYSSIVADQNTRTFHLQGNNAGDGAAGTFLVTATLSDGSVAPQTTTITGTGVFGLKCTFVAQTVCTLQIELKCTASPSGPNLSYFMPQFVWLAIPTPEVKPRGTLKYLLTRGIGGPLA